MPMRSGCAKRTTSPSWCSTSTSPAPRPGFWPENASALGLTPANDGTIIRIPIPPLTEERRKELVKVVHKFAEEGRVAIRHARTETLNKIKKTEHVSSDDQKHADKEVQKQHDDHLKGVDAAVKAKEAEIMEV